MSVEAAEALERLQAGNRRFASNQLTLDINDDVRRKLVEGQAPFAIILGCSDSRVPTEVVFDQGIGDLFVIRIAGNIVQPSQIGSVEFAAQSFGCRLVVVLGHTGCGAVEATIAELNQPTTSQSKNIASIVGRIQPAIESLFDRRAQMTADQLMQRAVRENVRYSANALRHGSKIIEMLIDDAGLQIVGAEYSLETGVVDFFDGATS
ncbi:MAG: carbonic anhydrase [Woeseiaceae bacterium]|nr:carbonic anhydrase [Woeseiaceae bacterium]